MLKTTRLWATRAFTALIVTGVVIGAAEIVYERVGEAYVRNTCDSSLQTSYAYYCNL